MNAAIVSQEGLVDFARLAHWMDESGLGHGLIENVEWIGGGTQNLIVRFERTDRAFVLRRPPLQSLSDGSKAMLRESQILRALAGTPVPHPPLIMECADREVLGEAFYLMEPVVGFNATRGLPELYLAHDAQRAMAFAVVDAIAELGRVDYVACGLQGFGKLDNYLERQTTRWRSQLDSYSRFEGWPGPQCLPGVEAVGAWLDAHRPDQFVPGIVHGDCHLANIMFRPDAPAIAAIVDWELATIGDPLLDLGWLIATWPGPGGENTGSSITVPGATALPTVGELIDRYAAASRRDMSHLRWMAVLACYKLGILQEGSHARACAEEHTSTPSRRDHDWAVAMMKRAQLFIDSRDIGQVSS
jgi:aminoglycoside phosphotransferase (APT) family kinase protein